MMNITQQQVRRRGSSLDEAAIRQSLSQGLLRPPSEDKEPGKFEVRGFEHVVTPMPPPTIQTQSPVPAAAHMGYVRKLLLGMFVAAVLGGIIAAIRRSWRHPPKVEEEGMSEIQNQQKILTACISNATAYCPHFPSGIIQKDYPRRFNRAGNLTRNCYAEEFGINDRCEETCELLFRKERGDSEGIIRVTLACKIGCNYAHREHETTTTSCHFDCKNTVWAAVNGKEKCNYDSGLGIATAEFESLYGTGLFGTGKACEMGCILGNARPCPMCEKISSRT